MGVGPGELNYQELRGDWRVLPDRRPAGPRRTEALAMTSCHILLLAFTAWTATHAPC